MLRFSACVVAVLLLGKPSINSWAQTQPTTPAPAALPAAPPAPAPATTSAADAKEEIIGRSYSVELKSGNTFIGVLRGATADELEFETKDIGVVRVQRANVKLMIMLTAGQASRGYDDVGNGNRLMFAPTARNLRKGEGYVQNLELFFLSANYGISDNFSMGALVSLIPGEGSYNIFALTPKASFPVSEKVHVGAGALLIFTQGETGGVAYGNATYGSADNNLTVGLGYGFSGRGGFINTPIVVVGGAVRVLRRVSLVNETYFAADNSFGNALAVPGIAGVRVAGPRLSGSLGALYTYYAYDDNYGYYDSRSGLKAFPFAEVSVRFGKIKH